MENINDELTLDESGDGIAEKIQSAKNILELQRTISALGTITSESGQVYSAEQISDAIETLFYGGGMTAETITRSFGLRDKVVDLYAREQAERVSSVEEAEALISVLYHLVGRNESLTGSSGEPMDKEELKASIRLIAEGNTMDTMVTRKYGLRDLAVRLRDE